MRRTRKVALAGALLAIAVLVGQAVLGVYAGAGDLAGGLTGSGPNTTIARLAALPADAAGAAAIRATAHRALDDPLSVVSAPVAELALPTVVADARLGRFPTEFARSVLALEQAALGAQSLADRATAHLTPAERATLVHDSQSTLDTVTAHARSIQAAVDANDPAAVARERDALASQAPSLVSGNDAALVSRVDTAALTASARLLQMTARAELPALRSYGATSNSAAANNAAAGGCSRPGPIYCDNNGLIEVWGTESNTYTENSVAKIRVDLGGNDHYKDQTGTALGDAAQCDTKHPGVGCARALAVKMNIDVSGDDTYSNLLGQGVGLVGVGVLVDGSGQDTYFALIGEGFGALGAGVLDDLSGNDSYGALAFGQGSGLLAGVGVLADHTGNDKYTSLAGSQGISLLGAGVVVDGAGNDVYHCLAICQGTGLGGAGAVIDGGGNDNYAGLELFGLRIPGVLNQAAGMLAGAGAVIDLGGNDSYGTLTMGLAMAQSANLVSTLTKMKQTDTFAVLFDGGGTDTYTANDGKSFGAAFGYALSRFWDLGHTVDTYGGKNHKPANNSTWDASDGTSTWLLGHDLGQPNGRGQDG